VAIDHGILGPSWLQHVALAADNSTFTDREIELKKCRQPPEADDPRERDCPSKRRKSRLRNYLEIDKALEIARQLVVIPLSQIKNLSMKILHNF
jgi:hypothetical protein